MDEDRYMLHFSSSEGRGRCADREMGWHRRVDQASEGVAMRRSSRLSFPVSKREIERDGYKDEDRAR